MEKLPCYQKNKRVVNIKIYNILNDLMEYNKGINSLPESITNIISNKVSRVKDIIFLPK